ncbi:MAG: alpha-ketoglutarate-dependent dioxygenase AlkB [Chloroflexi bacterium]|nr:alpha-ketoglutarate-dependent dioxygenase AlkB [Chloroflexota bacterium]
MTDAPRGLVFDATFLGDDAERELLRRLEALDFQDIVLHGVAARRTARHYGVSYDYERRASVPEAEPLPTWLEPLRACCATLAEVEPDALVETLVQRYPVGATIGWHRDSPAFGVVVGVSLGSTARLRFRRGAVGRWTTWELELPPRSAYVLAGEARTSWQHSIPPTRGVRYSVTFRTLRHVRRPSRSASLARSSSSVN